MTNHPAFNKSVDQLKAEAAELQASSPSKLIRGHALDQVARKHGFRDWNAAKQAASQVKSEWFDYPTALTAADFTLNLNDPSQFHEFGVARLLASRSGEENCQLRVSAEGVAYLSDLIGNQRLEGLAFRMETWIGGNGYAGLEAAQDPNYVRTIYRRLRENWPSVKYDSFVDS